MNMMFECPVCHSNAVRSTEKSIHKLADIDYHEHFKCSKCGEEMYALPYHDGTIKWLAERDEDMTPDDRSWFKSDPSWFDDVKSSEDIDISGYEYVGNVDGYFTYRKIEDGRGTWIAQDQDEKYPPFRITYDQARGYEPIDNSDAKKLGNELGRKLLSNSCVQCTVTYPNGNPVSDIDLDKYLDYNYGTDRDKDNSHYTDDEKQRSVDYWFQKHEPDPYIKSSEEFEDYEDEIKEIDQEFTSENTSINSTKLPAVFNMVKFEPNTINLDYGGGRFDNVADYLTQYDVINLVYDPYNRSSEHNREVVQTIRSHGGADTATCSNVLNVIKEPEVRLNVLSNISKLLKSNGTAYITVYEGTGKGDEGPTKSGYQLNRKTADYLEEVQQVFPDATRKGKLIICHKSGVASSVKINGASDIEDLYTLIRQDIQKEVIEKMKSFGFDEDEAKAYSAVDMYPDESGEYMVVEVRAELSYDGMLELCNHLDPVIEYYDSYAYFDMDSPGIATSFLNIATLQSVESATNTSNVGTNVNVFGFNPPYLDNSETIYEEEGDSIYIDLDTNVIVIDDGSYEIEVSNQWLHKKHYITSFDCWVDGFDIYDEIVNIIEDSVPDEPGTYKLIGDFELWYDVVHADNDYIDDEIYFNKNKSKINFSIS